VAFSFHQSIPATCSTQLFATSLTLQPSQPPEYGTGVESPLKSASRRPEDKGWTPWMAARGETRQDVESSRPQAAGREVSAVRSTDFSRGRGDW